MFRAVPWHGSREMSFRPLSRSMTSTAVRPATAILAAPPSAKTASRRAPPGPGDPARHAEGVRIDLVDLVRLPRRRRGVAAGEDDVGRQPAHRHAAAERQSRGAVGSWLTGRDGDGVGEALGDGREDPAPVVRAAGDRRGPSPGIEEELARHAARRRVEHGEASRLLVGDEDPPARGIDVEARWVSGPRPPRDRRSRGPQGPGRRQGSRDAWVPGGSRGPS